MADIDALGKLNMGIVLILHKYPLLGGLVASWAKREDPKIETIGVEMGADTIRLYYSPTFVNAITLEGLVAVLHHEVRHVIYGHVFLNPEDYPDADALRNAEEVTVNEKLPEKLPVRGILLRDFPILKANEDTLTRYKILAKQSKPKPGPHSGYGGSEEPTPSASDDTVGDATGSGDETTSSPARGAATPAKAGGAGGAKAVPVPVPGTTNPRAGGSGSKANNAGAKIDAKLPTAKSGKDKSKTSPRTGGKRAKGRQIDNHDRWYEIKANEYYVKATIAATLDELLRKGDKPTDYEKAVLEDALKGRGFEPGAGITELEQSSRSTLRWQILLRRYVGKDMERVVSYIRPPRRFADLVGIVPGHYNACSIPRIMAVIDTSGSMSDADLAGISKELKVMAAKFEVHIVECDSIIHRHYKYNGPIKTILGRGGTSFLPPLEPAFLKSINPDLILFFTDGDGDAPEKAPKVPVIWVLTDGGFSPVKWGKVLHMGPDYIQMKGDQ